MKPSCFSCSTASLIFALGTSLQAQTTAPTTADSSPLSEMIVTGQEGEPPPEYAGGQVAEGARSGLLGDRSVFDTPFSATSFTAEYIQNQQPRSVGDILLNDPSVNTQWPRGSFTERYQIRGFTVSGDEASFNGLFGIAPGTLTLPAAFERVELFKGPNSLLNGKVGSVGGSINYVTKRAAAQPIAQLTTTYASDGQVGAQVDLGRRFGKQGELGVRFNGLYADGDTEGEFQGQRLGLAALGVDYRRSDFRFSTDLIYQDTYQTAPRSQVYVEGDVAIRPPDAHRSYQQSWEYAGSQDLLGMFRAELDVTDHVTLYATAGALQDFQKQSRDIPILVTGFGDIAKGDFGSFPNIYRGWNEADSEQVGANARFEIGPTRHQLAISAARAKTTYGETYIDLTPAIYPQGIPNNLYDPITLPRPDFPHAERKGPKLSSGTQSSFAVADVASIWEDHLQAIVGARLQRVKNAGFDGETSALTDAYDEQKWTPAYTLLGKPLDSLSLYGSYIQALEQGPTAPQGTENAGQIFPPNDTEQYELGAKLDLRKWGITLAWFQISQPNGQTLPATGSSLPRFEVNGEQRNRGVEFSVFGEPAPGLRLLGGATYLDPVLAKTQDGAFDGREAPGNSDWVINLNAEYDTPFLAGFTVTGRINYQTEQWVDNANTRAIPDWVRFDLGARYATKVSGQAVTFRATCENVADKNYWASAANGYLLASPRTFLLSMTVDF